MSRLTAGAGDDIVPLTSLRFEEAAMSRRCVLLLKACDFGLDAREPLGGYQVRMR